MDLNTQSIQDYVRLNNTGYAVIFGKDLKDAKVLDITLERSSYGRVYYDPNMLIQCCQQSDFHGLMILSEGQPSQTTDEDFSFIHTATQIAAKHESHKEKVPVMRVLKKENLVEPKVYTTGRLNCTCFKENCLSIEDFLDKCRT